MEQQKGDLAKGHRPLARSSSSHSFSWGQVFRLWEFGGNSAPASAHLSPSALLSLSPSPREGPWMQAQAHFTAWKRVGAGQVTPEDWRNAPAVPTSPALKVQVRGWTWSGEKWGIPAPPPHQHNWLGCPPIPGYRHIIYGEGAGRCSLYSTSPAASPPPYTLRALLWGPGKPAHGSSCAHTAHISVPRVLVWPRAGLHTDMPGFEAELHPFLTVGPPSPRQITAPPRLLSPA